MEVPFLAGDDGVVGVQQDLVQIVGREFLEHREDVAAVTRRTIDSGMVGGGYILMASSSIHSAVKPENYLALLHTWRMYRQYPLALEPWQGETSEGFWA